MNTKQTAMNIRRAKSQTTNRTNQAHTVEAVKAIEVFEIDVPQKMKSKGAAIVGGGISVVGVGVGIGLHAAYAEKSQKNNKGKVVIKADYFEVMSLSLIVVLAGVYIMRLGLTLHDVLVKVKMTAEEHREYLKQKAEQEKLEKVAKEQKSLSVSK